MKHFLVIFTTIIATTSNAFSLSRSKLSFGVHSLSMMASRDISVRKATQDEIVNV